MDNLSPKGQLRPKVGLRFIFNNKGFLRLCRDANAGGAGGSGGDAAAGGADGAAAAASASAAAGAGNGGGGSAPSWKTGISTDLRNSPLLQKFDDTPDGLNKALEAHANLEKLLGHEKVPIPKDANDTEGWSRFSKAMGIPDKAEDYKLADAKLPETMKGMSIDKNKFAEVAHAHKLTPNQVQGLWKTYNDIQVVAYNKHLDGLQKQLESTVNSLKGEWGDTYQVNVELGQMVINQFSADKETNDFLTATLSKDPRGVKFLAKLGEQFAENKVPEFSMKRFSLAPEQAQEEINKILKDKEHPYNSEKATDAEHKRAVDYVNNLYTTINRAKG